MEETWKIKTSMLGKALQAYSPDKAARIKMHMQIAEGYILNMHESSCDIARIIAVGTYKEIRSLAHDETLQDILDFAVKRAQFYAQQGHGPAPPEDFSLF